MTKTRITFKDVCPDYIHAGKAGWEIRLEKGNIPAGKLSGRGISREDKASLRNYLKGLKALFNRACENRVCDDVRGNYNSIQEKYKAILKSVSGNDIELIGSGKSCCLTFYIDGSVSSYIEKTNISK